MKLFGPSVTDGYKLGHGFMYPEGIENVYSNLTPRSNRLFKGSSHYDGKVVVFGVQGALLEIQEMWDESFFRQPHDKVVKRYKQRVDAYLGEGVITYHHISDLWMHGVLPIEVKALPEGARINMKVPVFTIQATDSRFAWLVNYLETVLSAMVWKSCTNATIAYEYRRVLEYYAAMTGSPAELVGVQAHDFSARGMSGMEDAARSGAAHLTSFIGTDSVMAIDYVADYYQGDDTFIACSVPATEHSVSSSNILNHQKFFENDSMFLEWMEGWDSRLGAEAAFLQELMEKYPTGILSYVADTYDFWGVITKIIPELKKEILARQPNAIGLNKLVIRPDSGDPVKILTGMRVYASTGDKWYDAWKMSCDGEYDVVEEDGKFYEFALNYCPYDGDVEDYYIGREVPLHEVKGAVECLWDTFGGTVTSTGYKLLDEHIGLIYGDSITIARAEQILERLHEKGFASANVVFGIGSYTYQMNTRDTFGFAVKATGCTVDGKFIELYKDPATGDKLKKSAKGLLRVELDEDGEYVLYDQQTPEQERAGELRTIFRNGVWLHETTLEDVRKRLQG